MTSEKSQILPIMLALCLMLLPSYYAQNYAGIIGSRPNAHAILNHNLHLVNKL